jgi:hypothetical protein
MKLSVRLFPNLLDGIGTVVSLDFFPDTIVVPFRMLNQFIRDDTESDHFQINTELFP